LKYAFITQHKKTWPVGVMSRLLGVSRNAYYQYCQGQRNRLPDFEHEAIISDVKDVAESSKYSYGSRRMKHALGYPVGRRKARALKPGIGRSTRSQPTATTSSRCSTMYWPGNSPRPSRIKRSRLTSLTSGLRKVGCTWRCSSICSVDGLLTGAWVRG